MSDQEQFLARWSRRKHAAAQIPQSPKADAAAAATPASPAAVELHGEPAHSGTSAVSELPFDPATLPPIESITATTDIRPFLAPGVPPELTRAALRRVWTADPSIRDFVGLAEYAWDFNTPGSMPGFGAVEMTDQLRSEILRMVGRSLSGDQAATEAQTTAGLPDHSDATEKDESTPRPGHDGEPHGDSSWPGLCRPSMSHPPREAVDARHKAGHDEPLLRHSECIAVQNKPEESAPRPSPGKRLHGRALPK